MILALLNLEKTNEDSMKIFFNLNYSGETAVEIVASCVRKLYTKLNDKSLIFHALYRSLQIQKVKQRV